MQDNLAARLEGSVSQAPGRAPRSVCLCVTGCARYPGGAVQEEPTTAVCDRKTETHRKPEAQHKGQEAGLPLS